MSKYETKLCILEELDFESNYGYPQEIKPNGINILLIDDKPPGKAKGDYADLWNEFEGNGVFNSLGPLNLFWIQSVHAACLKLVDNNRQILPGFDFSSRDTIIFLDMTFIDTNEHGSHLSSFPKFKEYLRQQGIEYAATKQISDDNGIITEKTEGGEILLKVLQKAGLCKFQIYPWTSDPTVAGTRAKFSQFENKFQGLAKKHPDKNSSWESDSLNYQLLEEMLGSLGRDEANAEPHQNPLAELNLSAIPQEIIGSAYNLIFSGDLHNVSQIMKLTEVSELSEWKAKFLNLLNTEIAVGDKTGSWSQIDDEELQRVFRKIQEEVDKAEISEDLRIGVVKLKLMFLRNENKKVSLLDLFESLTLDGDDKVELSITYYDKSLTAQDIKPTLIDSGFSSSLWKQIEQHDFDIAEVGKEFNFYDIKSAIQRKVRENISGDKIKAKKVQASFYYRATGLESESRIVIKDDIGIPYKKDFAGSHKGQEFYFLEFVKEKLGADNIVCVAVRDVLSKPSIGLDDFVQAIRDHLNKQSYIITVVGLYTEVSLKVI